MKLLSKKAMQRISGRLFIHVFGFSFAMSLCSTAILGWFDYKRRLDIIKDSISQVEHSHIKGIVTSLWDFDYDQLRAQIEGIQNFQYIDYVAVLKNGEVIIQIGEAKKERIFESKFPLSHQYNGREIPLGTLYIQAGEKRVIDAVRERMGITLLFQAISVTAVALFILLIFERMVTRHLRRVADYLSAVKLTESDGGLKIDRARRYGDELDEVADTINTMQQRLAESYHELLNAEEKLQKQERHFQSILDNAVDVVTVLRADGTVIYNSPSLLHSVGFAPQEVQGKLAFQFIHPDDIDLAKETMAAVLKDTSLSKTIEFRFLNKEGRWLTFEGKARCLSETSVVFNSRDITGRKEMMEALRDSEERYRNFFRNNHAIMFIINPEDGKIIDANPAAATFYGYSIEQLQQMWITEINTLDLEQIKAEINRAHREEHQVFHFNHRLASGELRPVEVYSGPIDFHGKKLLFSIVHDISDRVKAEEKARQLQSELEQRVQERTQELLSINSELESFCYSVSHDLRGPLRHMQGYSSILLEDYADRLDEEGLGYLDRLAKSSVRMGQLVDDLLDLSRVSRCDLKREWLNLSALVTEIVAEHCGGITEQHIDVSVMDGITVYGDQHLLRIVVSNLIGNAFKYSSKSDCPRIEFGMTGSGAESIFFVRDNGAGFDMAHAGKLFQPFQRLHSPGEFEGNGIGLATVHRIIKRHGGRIWATAGVGEGACFFFTLGGHSGQAAEKLQQ